MPHVYVIRHGQTTCNAEGVIQGPRVDAALSETGRQQAARLGDAFASTPLDAVYVSPMIRARDTAAALMPAHLDAPPRVVPELYEVDFGHFCGQKFDHVRSEIEQIVDAWGMGFTDRAFPGGESPMLAQHRIRALAKELAADAQHRDVALVAHGRINRILIATLLGAPLSQMHRFPQSNAAITHLEVTDDGVHMRRMNDVAHLT